MSMNATHTYIKENPLRVGLFVVFAVLLLGASLALLSGYGSPRHAEAQMVSAVTVTGASTISSSVTSTASLTSTISNVIANTVALVTVTAQNNQNQNQGTNGTPSVTAPTGSTEVSQVVVTGQNNNDNPSTEPCCTEQPTTVEPAVVIATVPVDDNPFTLPCCTVPETTTTVPVILPVVTTTVVPAIVDFCPNISGLQNSVPAGMIVNDDGDCVPPPTGNAPVCTLSASAASVLPGTAVTLSWTTRNVTSATIDHSVGNATPVAAGSRATTVNVNTTYTLTGIGSNGQTVTCSAPVTVTPVTNAPACTLTASATSVAPGSAVTLSWTSQNLTSASIDQGVGNATPLASGSRSATVNANTTYTFTGTGTNGQTVTCSAPVTVTTTTPAPSCTLSASASTVSRGASVDLTWTTTNAASGSIDQGVGAATPILGGTKSAVVNADTTYTLTVLGNNGSTITCAAPVTITTGGGGGPSCVLTADPTTVRNGGATTLTWGGVDIVSVFIDNDVGTTTGPSGSQSVTVNGVGTHTYTGIFRTTSGTNLTCTAVVTVESGGGGCTSGCGGGGSSGPRILLSALKNPTDQPLSFVYLSQIPYTGLELGPWGTALYWLMLIMWSLAAAYLVFFTALPFAYQRAGNFGGKVKEALNTPAPAVSHAVAHSTHAAPATHGHAPAQASHGHDAHGSHASRVEEAPTGYQAHQGFRSMASGAALTIDDIVKGLAREAEARPQASAHDLRAADVLTHAPAPVVAEEVQVPVYVPAAEVAAPVARTETPIAPVSHDVREFLAALIAGNRDAVFGTVRTITREGGDSEEFLTHAVCALDDAYRSRVDGSVCHPDIASLTAACHPSFLERLVTSLTTAVDGSYSTGVTGVKLALTRALAVVNG